MTVYVTAVTGGIMFLLNFLSKNWWSDFFVVVGKVMNGKTVKPDVQIHAS